MITPPGRQGRDTGPAERVLLGWAATLEQVGGIDQKQSTFQPSTNPSRPLDTHAKGPSGFPTQTVFSVVGNTPSFSLRWSSRRSRAEAATKAKATISPNEFTSFKAAISMPKRS